MTREEAIEILRHNTNLGYGIVIENEDTKIIHDALDMAIRALRSNEEREREKE